MNCSALTGGRESAVGDKNLTYRRSLRSRVSIETGGESRVQGDGQTRRSVRPAGLRFSDAGKLSRASLEFGSAGFVDPTFEQPAKLYFSSQRYHWLSLPKDVELIETQ